MARSWSEVDWQQDRPTLDELIASWTSLAWERVTVEEQPLLDYAETLRGVYRNGDVLLGRWRATGATDVAAWFVSRNQLDYYELHRHLFDDPVVREDLQEIEMPEQVGRVPAGLAEQWQGALSLDGLLAGLLVLGGAYRSFDGRAAQAKEIAARAVWALIGDRYEDVRVDLSHAAWTPWFRDIAWDTTIVVTDRGRREVTVLLATDSD